MIAARAMKVLPRGKEWGDYPQNSNFGPITVDWQADRSIYYDGETLLYSNGLQTNRPIETASLKQIAGTGSSTVVNYNGSGTYFLDKLADGVWMLEVYPGAKQLRDPFAHNPSLERQIFAYDINGGWMTIQLPDLGNHYHIHRCLLPTEQTEVHQVATQGGFAVEPARYILSANREEGYRQATARRMELPFEASLMIPALEAVGYQATVQPSREYHPLFTPKTDYNKLIFTRGGFFSPSYDVRLTDEGTLRLWCDDLSTKEEHWFPADISVQHTIGDRLHTLLHTPQSVTLVLRVRALTSTTRQMRLLLSESDFGSWGTEVTIGESWQEISIRSIAFKPDRTPQLPQDWPGFGPYYRPDFGGTETYINWPEVEHLYFSLRAEDFDDRGTTPKGIEIAWVKLLVE